MKWFIKSPRPDKNDFRIVANLSNASIQNRLKLLFPNGTDNNKFNKYKLVLDQIVALAKTRNMQITFIIPTTLLPKLPGMDKEKALLSEYKKNNINYYNLSKSITDLSLYSDTDHLNTKGVIKFTNTYLKTLPEFIK